MKKKQIKSIFFRNKDIVASKKKVDGLIKEQRESSLKIDEIITFYNSNAGVINSFDQWLETLSIQSLKDLYNVENNKKNDYNLTQFKLITKLRDEHTKEVENFNKLEDDIYLSNVDLLLAKIACVQKKIEEK